jgi:uncharacterized membrane protein YgdD (TMEM256/DUF423 family)
VLLDVQSVKSPRLLLVAAGSGLLAVLLGAFASHGLQLDGQQQGWMELANRYHFYHTLALLLVAMLPPGRLLTLVAGAWIIGILLFCGSLYLGAMTSLQLFWLTPIGGVLLLLGWGGLLLSVWRGAR